MKSFAQTLKEFRERAGLSQYALAGRAGIDPSYVNRVERGERDAPTREVVEALAQALELNAVETDDLLLSAGYAPVSRVALRTGDPTMRLLFDILDDENVPREEIEHLRDSLELIRRRWPRGESRETQ